MPSPMRFVLRPHERKRSPGSANDDRLDDVDEVETLLQLLDAQRCHYLADPETGAVADDEYEIMMGGPSGAAER